MELTSTKKIFFLNLLMYALCTISPQFLEAADEAAVNFKQADIVWAQSDGLRNEIYFATYDGEWSKPVQLTDDNANNLHPQIARDSSGKRWVVWTAMESSGLSIHYTVHERGIWADPVEVNTGLTSNITPSITIFTGNTPWLVWAGNDGGLDDIYYSPFQDNAWQKPGIVNTANDVPDILPQIEKQGNKLQVTWVGYRSGKYIKLRSSWTGRKWGDEFEVQDEVKNEENDADLAEAIPSFVPDPNQAFLRIYSK